MKLKMLLYLSMYTKCVCRRLILPAHVYVCACFYSCVQVHVSRVWVPGCACAAQPVCAHALFSTVWPSLVLPAVLTLVRVDSKHSCRSERPRSGQTRGSEGQWWRGERAYTEHEDRKGKVELEREAILWSGTDHCEEEEEMVRKERKFFLRLTLGSQLEVGREAGRVGQR